MAAMATQNALVKLDLPGFPTTAVLTTDTVLLAIDFVTWYAAMCRLRKRPRLDAEYG